MDILIMLFHRWKDYGGRAVYDVGLTYPALGDIWKGSGMTRA